MVKRVVTGERRRSARISALEEGSHVRQTTGTSSLPPVVSRKRGCKRKSLLSVVTRSLAQLPHQEVINLNDGGSGSHLDEPEHLSSPQPMPPKHKLEFFLDILQRRDRYEIFAQPVDGQEVVGYNDTIKEPMDFGTMRAKLQEGMYTSLEQFERDVFLISSNAMKFNSSNTVYYTEARAISELAQRLFRALRKEPENFEVDYTRTRRRPGRKPQGEASTSNAQGPKSGSLNDLSMKRTKNASTSGARDGRILNSCETDKRMTYMPWTICSENDKLFSEVLNAPKLLQLVYGEGRPYSNSLMRFVKDLGPTAQMVARRKYPSHEVPNRISAAYKGKAVCTEEGANNTNNGDNMDLLIATLSQTSNPQNHAPRINNESYFTWLLNHPDPSPTKPAASLFCSPTMRSSNYEEHNVTNLEGPGLMQPIGLGRQPQPTSWGPAKIEPMQMQPQPTSWGPPPMNFNFLGGAHSRDHPDPTSSRPAASSLGSPAPHLLRQSYVAKTLQPNAVMHMVPNREGLGSAASSGFRLGGLVQPDRLRLGPVASEQSQAVEWRRPQSASWGLPPIHALHEPAHEQIALMQMQSQVPAGNMMNFNFLGGANARDYQQVQRNAQIIQNRQPSSVNGSGLPDLDLQL